MDIRLRIGLNLKRLRQAQGWSQEELADRSGYHRTYVSGIERGVRNPTATVIDQLAKTLEASPAEFFEPPGKPGK